VVVKFEIFGGILVSVWRPDNRQMAIGFVVFGIVWFAVGIFGDNFYWQGGATMSPRFGRVWCILVGTLCFAAAVLVALKILR